MARGKKHKKTVENLAVRIKDYEEMCKRASDGGASLNRPGSLSGHK